MFNVLIEKSFIVFYVLFLFTIQRREISLIFASPLAAKFCTKTKKKGRPLSSGQNFVLRLRLRLTLRVLNTEQE
jgi:hypothetical protein